MRIQHQPETSTVDRASVKQVAKAPAVAAPSEATVTKAGSEKVTVSAEARGLADKQQVNAGKLDRIKASLQDGSFKVDAHAIAAKLVGDGES